VTLATSLSANPRPFRVVRIAHPGGMIVTEDPEIAGAGTVASAAHPEAAVMATKIVAAAHHP